MYAKDSFCAYKSLNSSVILSFQTKELRDKFLNNFKNLINQVKELI